MAWNMQGATTSQQGTVEVEVLLTVWNDNWHKSRIFVVLLLLSHFCANSLFHLHAHLISFIFFDDGDAHCELRLVFEAASMYVIQYSHRSVATSGVARIIDLTTAFQ